MNLWDLITKSLEKTISLLAKSFHFFVLHRINVVALILTKNQVLGLFTVKHCNSKQTSQTFCLSSAIAKPFFVYFVTKM